MAVLCLISCQDQGSYSSDPELIAKGEQIFVSQCSSCHNFQRSGIGPALGGVTRDTTAGWLREFIKNPGRMVERGDRRSVRLNQKYHTGSAGLRIGVQAPFYEVRLQLEGGPIITMRHLIGDQNRVDLRFGYGQKGEMYIFTKSDGKIYKIIMS